MQAEPWAINRPVVNLSELAAQLWVVDEAVFCHTCKIVIPELSYYVGATEASPSGETEHSPAKKEELRTVGALLTLYWLLREAYDVLTHPQTRSRYLQLVNAYSSSSLTRESFARLCTWISDVVKPLGRLDAMLAQMAIHDLGKVSKFAHWIAHETGATTEDHDALLLLAMQRRPACLPSFAGLPAPSKDLIIRGWSLGLNVGQLMQGEAPAAMLLATKALLQHPHGLEALEFFLAHALLDISGVQGHITLKGSPVLTEDLCASFLLARDAVLQLRDTSVTPADAYHGYMRSRGKLLDLHSVELAFMRLICMLRITDHEALVSLQHSWDALAPHTREVLTIELAKSGLSGGDEAIVLYYAPQLLVNSLTHGVEGLKRGLELCAQVFTKTRLQMYLTSPLLVTVNIASVAAAILLNPMPETVTVTLNATREEGRAKVI